MNKLKWVSTASVLLMLLLSACSKSKDEPTPMPGQGVMGDWVTMDGSAYYNILFSSMYTYTIRTGADDVIENGNYTVNVNNGIISLTPNTDGAKARTWRYTYQNSNQISVTGLILSSDTKEKTLSLIRQSEYDVKTVTVHSTATKSELTLQMLMGASRIKLEGEINQGDFQILHDYEPMTELDMSDVTIVGDIVIMTDSEGQEVTVEGNAIPEAAFGALYNEYIQTEANTTLKKIILPKNLEIVGFSAFSGCQISGGLEIPASVELLMSQAFSSCCELTGITFPGDTKLKEIHLAVFEFCTGLTGTITMPKTLAGVSGGTFRGCINLEKVVLPNEMLTIGTYAFIGCKKMKSINIPTSLEQVYDYAFTDCEALTGSLTFPSGTTLVDSYAYTATGYNGTLSINKEMIKIGKYAFSDTKFASIILPWTADNTDVNMVEYDTWFPADFLYGGSKKIQIPAGTKDWYIANMPHKTIHGQCFYNIEEK